MISDPILMLQFSPEDEAEYNNWPDMLVDTGPPVEFNTALITSVNFSHTAALFAHAPEPAIFLDSGVTAHISCIQNCHASTGAWSELSLK